MVRKKTSRKRIETLKDIRHKQDQKILQFRDKSSSNFTSTLSQIQEESIYKQSLDSTRRVLSTPTYPCLAYQDDNPNKCAECDEDNGYYLWPRNYTHVLCAEIYQSYYCKIPEAYYPQEYAQFTSLGYTYLYYEDYLDGYKTFCYRNGIYHYSADSVVTCDTFYLSTDDLALSSIYYLTPFIWCMSCTVTGYENEVVLYYEALGFFISACSADTPACLYTQYLDTSSNTCIDCTKKYKNCAACNTTACIICYQNYAWNDAVYDYSTGTYIGECMFQTCPQGTCLDRWYGTCATSNIDSNCLRCIGEDNEFECTWCKSGYYLSSGACQEIESGTLNVNLFVTSSNYVYMESDSANAMYDNDGLSPDEPFTYLQEALHYIYQYEVNYTEINATIYIGQGEHFFFLCSGNEEDMYEKDDMQIFYEICNDYNLYNYDAKMDNKNITIQALECSMASELDYTHNAAFWSMCANVSTSIPTIYVQNPYAFINSTGKLVIKNLKFSGINAMAVPQNSIYDVSKYPVKLCGINTEPTGEDGTISLSKYTQSSFNVSYKCKDKYYSGSNVPTSSTSQSQCISNSYSQFSTTKTSSLGCGGYVSDSNYYTLSNKGIHYYRAKTLFNFYSFSDMTTMRNKTPELYIENCQFEYFLSGYESLINVETNQFDVIEDTFSLLASSDAVRNTLVYQQGDRGIKITIINSVFKHSRFCKGMIVYRKAPYDDSSSSLLNLTHYYMKWPVKYDNDSYIYISKSTFYNLNAFANVSALADYGGVDVYYQYSTSTFTPVNLQQFMHKGIVLNVEDFGGRVEIVDCIFKRNFNFIPAVYYGHIYTGTTFNADKFKDGNTGEYQLASCDEQYYIDTYFFQQGISQSDDIDEYYDTFERLSVIYISRNRNKIIIKDNTFQQSIGTFGGAISINSPNWDFGNEPYILIYNNIFKNNMAYLSGNAIYIRLIQKSSQLNYACAGVSILQNTFTNNIGMKIHNGGAISTFCYQIDSKSHQDYFSSSAYPTKAASKISISSVIDGTTLNIYSSRFNIEDNYFESNFAGMKGTAVYIRQVTNIRIQNCTFLSNGPVYATNEYQYSPFSNWLSSTSATFYDSDCFDELEFLSKCNDEANQMIIWPRVQGAVHVIFCQSQTCINPNYTQILEISDSYFVKNQAGPILDFKYTSTYATASQIHIVGGFNNMIQNNQFIDNDADYTSFPNTKGVKLTKYFPSSYFVHSMSSLINIYISPDSSTNYMTFNTTFYQNKFYRNKNIQVLGFQEQQWYQGSLIKAVNYAYNADNYLPIINIVECDFKDNYFLGDWATLIYIYNLVLHTTKSTFINNGQLFSSTTTKDITDLAIDSPYNNFYGYTYDQTQEYGIFQIEGSISFSKNNYHKFINNTFNYIFAEQGSAYSFFINNQYAYFFGNTYKYLFSSTGGPLIYAEGSTGRSTLFMDRETANYLYGGSTGAVTIAPSKQDRMSIYCNNSYFNNILSQAGSGFNLQNAAKATINNVTFTRTDFRNDMATYIRSQFKQYSIAFNKFAEQTIISTLTNNVYQETGYINMLNVENTKEVKFVNQVLHKATYKYINYVEAIDCDFNNSITEYSTVADVSYSSLRIANTFGGKRRYISNTTGTQAGPIGLYFSSKFVGENLYFYNSTSKAKASAFYMSESQATIINTTFIENNAQELGTVVVETNSDFTCEMCLFIKNYAFDSSGIFTYNNLQSQLLVTNSKFLNNTSVSNLMTLLYTKAKISNTIFVDNISEKVNNGLTMINSNVVMMNTTINFTNTDYIYNNDYNVDTGFISLNYQSYLLIQYSTIQYCRGSISAFMYVTGASEVYILDSTIKNIASRIGAVIYGSMALGVNVNRVKFISNSQQDFYLENTIGYIYNSYFYEGMQSFIYVVTGYVDLQNNTFTSGSNLNTYGKALYCYCIELNATNNVFNNLSAVQGGAIYIQSTTTSKFIIKNNNFTNNFAQMGGAIFIISAAYLDILNNNFIFNTAKVISPQSLESSQLISRGLGGAIYYACTDDDIRDQGGCIVNIKQSNLFLSNYAQDEGGAIQRVSNAYTEDGTNRYINNSAFYGSDSASFPKSISVVVLDNGDYVNPYSTNTSSRILIDISSKRVLQDISYVPTFVSGTPFSFNVYILDQYGNIYNADSTSKCAFKYTGTDSSSVIVTNNEVVSKQGVYYFANVSISTKPGAQMSFKLEITGLQTYDNSIEFVDSPFQFNVSVRECVMGEELTSDYKCRTCAAGTYLYYPPNTETPCKECPANAVCFGRYFVAPNPSYWRSSNVSENFILCENVDACLGGDEKYPMGVCAKGYQGIICGDCDDNYSKTKQFECAGCPDRVRNIFQVIAISIAAVGYVVFLVRSTLNSADKPKPLYSVYLKIMTNHFQVLSAISNINYKWPATIQKFEENQNSVSSVSDQVFSFDCFFMNDGKDNGVMPIYYQKLLMFGLLPMLLAMLDFAVWAVICTIKGRDYSQLRSKFTSTLVVLLFLVHPNIAKTVFLSFNCVEIDGVYHLKENISSICYQNEHLTYMLIISVPSVFAWALGIPFFALLLLVANKKILYLQDETKITETENRKIIEAKTKYGFIFAGYKGQTYYWEVILLYRKIGIIMATVYLSTFSNEAQVLAVMLIIVVCMLLQINYKPYYTKTLNQMELYSLQVSAITLYAGMYYVTGQHYRYMDNEGLAWFFLTFIVSPNLLFILFWVYYMRIEVIKEVYNRKDKIRLIQKIFKILACTSIAQFEKDYIIPERENQIKIEVVEDGTFDREKKAVDMDPDNEFEEEPISYNKIDEEMSQVDVVDIKVDLEDSYDPKKKMRYFENIPNKNLVKKTRKKSTDDSGQNTDRNSKSNEIKVYPAEQMGPGGHVGRNDQVLYTESNNAANVREEEHHLTAQKENDDGSDDSDNGYRKKYGGGSERNNKAERFRLPKPKKPIATYNQKIMSQIRKRKQRRDKYKDKEEADHQDIEVDMNDNNYDSQRLKLKDN